MDSINQTWQTLTESNPAYQIDVGVTYRVDGKIDAGWTSQPAGTIHHQRPVDQNNPRYEQRARTHNYTLLSAGMRRYSVTITAAPAIVKLTA